VRKGARKGVFVFVVLFALVAGAVALSQSAAARSAIGDAFDRIAR
jgi:hypothetical protein